MIGVPRYGRAARRKQGAYNRLIARGVDPEDVMVPGDGPTPARVMIVGMRPGKDEPLHDPPRPFIGLAGRELDRYLRLAGLEREEVYVTNLVKNWVEGDREPEEWEVVRDSLELVSELSAVRPDVVVPLGAVATRRFVGEWATMDLVSGIPHRNGDGVVIFPIVHPAAGLHNADIQPNIYDGFRRLGGLLGGTIDAPTDEWPNPIYSEAVKDAIWWHPNEPVAIDTEGTRHDPIFLQFTRFPGEGRLIQADDKNLLSDFQRAIRISGREGRYILHNSLHDLGVLGRIGVEIPEGQYVDTMVLAYLLCLEPQGLKALAYRHNGRMREEYDEVISEASKAKAYEYIGKLREYDWGEAEEYVEVRPAKGGGLAQKVHRPHSLNRRLDRIMADYAKAPGACDIRKRWGKLVSDNPGLVDKVDELIGGMPTATLRDVEPSIALRYACADSDDTLRVYPKLIAQIYEMGLEGVCQLDHDVIPITDRMQHIGMRVNLEWFDRVLPDRMRREMEEIQARIRIESGGWWVNPDSPDQCAEYLFTSPVGPRLPWTKMTDSGKRPKCDDKVLEGLIAQAGGQEKAHPVLRLITDYRERSKIVSSFCRPIVRFSEGDGDGRWGRIHPNLRITRVSSGRLAANSPNLLAIPVRTELGLEVRRGFNPGEGRVLSSRDLDQIEMREMAHQSQDPEMLRIFREGKVDIHTRTAAMMYGKRDEDVKKIERYAAKRIGFGIITGITEVGLKAQMDLAGADGWTEDRCKEAIGEYLAVYGGVRQYMEDCRAEARRYDYVRDRWGRIRYLPGIHSPIAKVRAEAERQSHSFKISASAQGTMKRVEKLWWDEVWHPIHDSGAGYVEPQLQIHDSLLREVDECWAEEEDRMTEEVMSRADPMMTVPIKSKGKWGPTWADLE